MVHNISSSTWETLEDFGIEVHKIPKHLPTKQNLATQIDGRDSILWTKLFVWSLVQYAKVVLVDSDVVVLKEIDCLCLKPSVTASAISSGREKIVFYDHSLSDNDPWNTANWERYTFKPEDMNWIGLNSGVMVLEPSLQILHDMTDKLSLVDKRLCCPSQEFIFLYFEQRNKYFRLPPLFHVRSGLTEHSELMFQTHIYHFVSKTKPWDKLKWSEDPFVKVWEASYNEVKAWLASSDKVLPAFIPRNISIPLGNRTMLLQ